jgi:Protein of unknown function (DUF3592)
MIQIIRIAVCTLMALFFGSFGMVCLWAMWLKFRQGIESESWPSTQAWVTGFRVHSVSDEMSSNVTYSYSLVHAYVVDRIGYEFNGGGSGGFRSYQAAEQAAQTRHTIGQTTKVFYNPRKPQISVLLPGLDLGCFLTFLIAFPMAIGMTVLAFNLSVEVLGLLLIGAPPETGCHKPDLAAKQWLPIVCPPADAI